MHFPKQLQILIILLTLFWPLTACGGGEEAPPPAESTTPVEATTEAAAVEESESVPTEAPAATASLMPATTVNQAVAMIDLRDLAQPDGVTPGQVQAGYLSYQAPLAVAEVADFYRELLTDQGWQEDSEHAYVDETTATLYYTKEGFTLSFSASQMSPDSTLVTLQNHGNVDLQSLPQIADAESGFVFPNILTYFSPTPVVDVVRFTRSELAAQGWLEFVRPNTATADNPESQTRTFIQNGLELTAFVTVAPAQDGKTSVQYSLALLPGDMPAPADATDLEFDKAEPYLAFKTGQTVEALIDFYREAMPTTGWSELPDSASIAPEGALLSFANEADETALMVELIPGADNLTQVTLQGFDAATLADSLAAADEPESGSETEVAEVAAPDSLPAFLLPDDAQEVALDATDLSFTSASDIETLVDFYRQVLAGEGWQESADLSEVDETFAFIEFDRGDEAIYLTLFAAFGPTEVSLDLSEALSLLPAGSLEEEVVTSADPDSDAPTTTIADWPVPPEATEVNLSGETLSYKTDLDLPALAEFYLPTFEEMGLGSSCLEDVADYTSISCSSGSGELSLNFFAFEGFDDTEVEITFTNYAYPLSPSDADSGDSGELTAIDQDGLPLPSDYTGYSSESSPFRSGLSFTSPSPVESLADLLQAELIDRGYEVVDTSEDDPETTIVFDGPEGALRLTLKSGGSETEGHLVSKNAEAAAAAGILPPAGQARVYLINPSEQDLSVLINDQTFDIPAGAGMESPDDAQYLDLRPANYRVTTSAGGSSVNDEITVGTDEVWSLLLDEHGALPLQMY